MAHMSTPKSIYNPKYKSKFNFRLSFLTLTLSSRQQHTDQILKAKLLHPFLDWCIKVHHVKNYVWKAERQRNGNLHIHLIIDKYIHYAIIRERWNKYQDTLGYINQHYIDNASIKTIPNNIVDYLSVNSTDVHAVKNIRNLDRYLIKYMIKADRKNKLKIKRNDACCPKKNYELYKYLSQNTKNFLKSVKSVGRLWGASHSLCNISGARDFLSNAIESEIIRLKNSGKVYVKDESYFLYLGYDYRLLVDLQCKNIIDFLHQYLYEQFGYSSSSYIL